MDWVDLAIIDLSQFDSPGGREKLAAQLYDALKNIGRRSLIKRVPNLTPYRIYICG